MIEEIRLATVNDLEAVERVIHDAYSHYIARIGRQPGPMLDAYKSLIATGHVRVVEHTGMVQGVLVLIPEDNAMLLDNIAVSATAQGLGLGRKMLAFAERAALDARYNAIRLYTNAAMTENIELYSRIGYVETHRIVEKGFQRVYMAKPLG